MKNILLIFLTVSISIFAKVSHAEKELIKFVVPGTKIKDIDKTPIDGMYIVLLESKKFLYVYPFKKIILFGEMVSNDGRNISVILKDKLLKANEDNAAQIEEFNKNKENVEQMKNAALQVIYNQGNSKYTHYVFTDPDCPFCRKLEEYFTKNDVDVKYLFTPIDRLHPKAEEKVRKILSHKKQAKLLLERVRKEEKIDLSINDKSKDEILLMKKIAKSFKFSSTPVVLVYDKKAEKIIDFIKGADVAKLKKYKEVKDEK